MARSTFYYFQKQSVLPDKYQVVKALIKSIYHNHQEVVMDIEELLMK